jgi:hypothetical protein
MIRQAINCDICGAEKQATSYWFVAYEQGSELKLNGWGSMKNTRKEAKHVCGQKCAQRLVANFMASVMTTGQSSEAGLAEAMDYVPLDAPAVSRASQDSEDRSDRAVRGRVDAASVESDSWAGPVRVKEDAWDMQNKRTEAASFLHATRGKTQTPNRLHRTA